MLAFIIVCSLIIIVFGLTFSFVIAYLYGAVVVSSNHKVAQRALTIARLKPGETFIDLGSGWGNIINLAKVHFKANAIGYEISPLPFIYSICKGNKTIFTNLSNADLKHADLVYIYLSPKLIKSIVPLLTSSIDNGTRVLSITFPIPGLIPKKLEKYHRHKIFLYYK